MKVNELLEDNLIEMTMKAGNLDTDLKRIFDYFVKNVTDEELTHIGDIDNVRVMRWKQNSNIVDFFVKNDSRIGFSGATFSKTKVGEVLEISNWYIEPEERRKDLGFKYLYFLKNVLKTKILFGDIHSKSNQEFLKKQHNLKRFEVSWLNMKTGEIEPFDKDKYGSGKKTDWKVLIESDETEHQMFDQFKTEVPSLKNSYEWLFDGIENL